MTFTQVEIANDGMNWLVRVATSLGVQVFSCATEPMALQFAAVFERAPQELQAA